MTPAAFRLFISEVRAEATSRLARLATIDPDELLPELRQQYHQSVAGWRKLLAMTEDEAVELHLAACEAAGRELTDDELRGLQGRQ